MIRGESDQLHEKNVLDINTINLFPLLVCRNDFRSFLLMYREKQRKHPQKKKRIPQYLIDYLGANVLFEILIMSLHKVTWIAIEDICMGTPSPIHYYYTQHNNILVKNLFFVATSQISTDTLHVFSP